MSDRKSCGYKPRNERTKKGKVNERARRTGSTLSLLKTLADSLAVGEMEILLY